MLRSNLPINQAVKIKRVIFDFDFTISREHIHFFLTDCLLKRKTSFYRQTKMYQQEEWSSAEIDEMWNLLIKHNKHLTTGDPRLWRNIFTTLLDQDYQVAIASFSSFGPILRRFLKEVIELPEPYLEKIRIEAWLPDATKADKNNHLDRIILNVPANTPTTETPLLSDNERKQKYKQLILVDDSKRNTTSVEQLTSHQNIIAINPHDQSTPTRIIHILNQRLELSIPLVQNETEVNRNHSPLGP